MHVQVDQHPPFWIRPEVDFKDIPPLRSANPQRIRIPNFSKIRLSASSANFLGPFYKEQFVRVNSHSWVNWTTLHFGDDVARHDRYQVYFMFPISCSLSKPQPIKGDCVKIEDKFCTFWRSTYVKIWGGVGEMSVSYLSCQTYSVGPNHWQNHYFYRAACNADAVLWWEFCLSVRPSVCPSVCHTRVLWQNGRKICPDLYTIRKNI